MAPAYAWTYPFHDDSRRSYAGFLRCPWTKREGSAYFELIRGGTEWIQPSGNKGLMPRKTAWLVKQGCECVYSYGPFQVPAEVFPSWMVSLLQDVMPKCGISNE